MSHELKEGLELRRVLYPGSNYTIGSEVESITVVEQRGQMGLVPWAKVVGTTGKMIALLNLATCETVEIRNGQ